MNSGAPESRCRVTLGQTSDVVNLVRNLASNGTTRAINLASYGSMTHNDEPKLCLIVVVRLLQELLAKQKFVALAKMRLAL